MSGLAKINEPKTKETQVSPSPSRGEGQGGGDRGEGVSGRELISRRSLLKGIYRLMVAVGGGSLFYGLYRFLAPGGGIAPPVEIPLSEVAAGGTYSFQYGGSPGILISEEDGGLRALSLVCTHMACTVVWNPEKKEFHCPCHDALFDIQGNVLSGPPPSPLERWKVQVLGDEILVGGI